ncbi:MAG: chromate efflux transporter [Silvibacterium sp.]|nr:chromate efflux transporter [Silvibacterium sp.]
MRANPEKAGGFWEVFLIFLRLGCTSFGGPVAHLGYFQSEFVERRAWLSGESFAELVALAQSLPGPASSQVGFSIGLSRAGLPGGLAAWLGFTAPSAALMLAFAFGHSLFNGKGGAGLLHGLQLVAVAVVAQAVLAMQQRLAPDGRRLAFVIVAVAIVLFAPPFLSSIFAILAGALGGLLFLRLSTDYAAENPVKFVSRRTGSVAAAIFALLLIASLAIHGTELDPVNLFANLFRAGSLVFGGGHVVLPLLDGLVVAKGWISQRAFLAGYGAAQALPGPLFSFAAYVGAAVRPNSHPLAAGLIALIAIFLPGLLLMTAILPYWGSLRRRTGMQSALRGVNASVVGVLIAALYKPVWTSSVHSPPDFWIALSAFMLLTAWRVAPWVVVVSVGGVCWLRIMS